MSQNLPERSLRDFLSLRHPNHFVLAGANNRNVIITYQFLVAPVQPNAKRWRISMCVMLNSLSPNFALSKLFIGFIKRLRIVTFSVRNSNLLCSSALDYGLSETCQEKCWTSLSDRWSNYWSCARIHLSRNSNLLIRKFLSVTWTSQRKKLLIPFLAWHHIRISAN